MFGSVTGYTLMYLAGTQWGSYWAYAAGLVINSLFSGAMTLVTVMIQKMFPPDEAEKYNALVMSVTILGAVLGAIIMIPFT
eukprot:SAG31_NODE_16193_length_719_cov_1.079032_1_plen_80_part_10